MTLTFACVCGSFSVEVEVDEHKARLLLQGDCHICGISYTQVIGQACQGEKLQRKMSIDPSRKDQYLADLDRCKKLNS